MARPWLTRLEQGRIDLEPAAADGMVPAVHANRLELFATEKQDILSSNERNVNLLETRHFGRLGFVEIGALSVGWIVQTNPLDKPFQRGQEKSVFRFGGSAIVVFGKRGGFAARNGGGRAVYGGNRVHPLIAEHSIVLLVIAHYQ